MAAVEPGNDETACPCGGCTQVELTVKNHPDAVADICSLFSGKIGSVDGILSIPADDGRLNRIILLISDEKKIDYIVKQLMELDDVLDVRCRGAGPDIFIRMEEFFRSGTIWFKSATPHSE